MNTQLEEARPSATGRSHRDLLVWSTAVFAAVTALRFMTMWFFATINGKNLGEALVKWDVDYYVHIAREGYIGEGAILPLTIATDESAQRMAFFPLLPWLLKAPLALGLSPLVAGLLISIPAGIALTAAVMKIAEHCGANRWQQAAAATVVLGAPVSVAYSMAYTEALFGALAYWALYAMLKDRVWWAAGLVFFAGLTRVTALILIIVFAAWAVARAIRQKRVEWQPWVALAASASGIAAYLGWVQTKASRAGGYFAIQDAGWDTGFDFGASVAQFLKWAFTGNDESITLIAGLVIIGFVILAATTFTTKAWPVWLFAVGIVSSIVLSGGVITSRPRLLLPALIALAPHAQNTQPKPTPLSVGMLTFWVILGAVISLHVLTATPWAI